MPILYEKTQAESERENSAAEAGRVSRSSGAARRTAAPRNSRKPEESRGEREYFTNGKGFWFALRNLSISKRLALGFGVLLAFLLCMAAAGYWGTSRASAITLELLRTDAYLEQSFSAAAQCAIELQRYEKDVSLNLEDRAEREKALENWR